MKYFKLWLAICTSIRLNISYNNFTVVCYENLLFWIFHVIGYCAAITLQARRKQNEIGQALLAVQNIYFIIIIIKN